MSDSAGRTPSPEQAHASAVLASQFESFVPWLMANGSNPIWATRTVGEEVARVVLSTLEGAGLTLVRTDSLPMMTPARGLSS